MIRSLDNLASYVPRLVIDDLQGPVKRVLPAAVIFADISGFTALSSELAKHGALGAEELTGILNAFFGALIEVVSSFGGDIIKFAGDAALIVLPDEDDLRKAVLRAAGCGLELRKLNGYQAAENVRLSLRVGIGAGEILAGSVGGVFRRYEFLVAGEPLLQIAKASDKAKPGQVVLSPQSFALIHENVQGELADDHFILENLTAEQPRKPLPEILPKPGMEFALRSYVPGAILSRLDAGQIDWLAELRRVSVFFLNIRGFDYQDPDVWEKGQTVMQVLQRIIYRYEGSVNQYLVDDKGTNLLAAFGLPPLAHEDDAIRAIQAAWACHTELKKLGVDCSIGIATGQIFCGLLGNEQRRSYTLIGDTVNLAARLMKSTLEILCDSATFESTKNRIEFEILEPVKLKGKTEPVPIYRPVHLQKSAPKQRTLIVGRLFERATLVQNLQELARGKSNTVVIEGEAGMGKSRLINEFERQAEMMQLPVFKGGGDATEKTTPYFAWRSIFSHLLGVEADLQEPLFERLASLNAEKLAPLLNPVLPFNVPENEFTSRLTGQNRADTLLELLLKILESDRPKVILLEDAHWFDSASWSLVLAIQNLKMTLLVVSSRQNDKNEYRQLLNSSKHLLLHELTKAETIELVCTRLGVYNLPTIVEKFIERAEGHPFFSEEIAYALRDSGFIEIKDGVCSVSPHVDLANLPFPTTIQGVIISRIDRLSPQQQLTLKVASVIGRVFTFDALRDTYPIENEEKHLSDDLNALSKLDITLLESQQPELSYIFKHIITQEVAYNLMSFSQRERLHEKIAAWYETKNSINLAPYYSLLVYHYHQAGNAARERFYAKLAGKQAVVQFANIEAIDYLTRAFELSDDDNERFELLVLREKVFNLQGMRKEQSEDLSKLTQLAKTNDQMAEVLILKSNLANLTGQYGTAKTYSLKALALSTENKRLGILAEFELAKTLYQLSKYEEAYTKLNKLLNYQDEIDEIRVEILRYLIIISLLQGDRSMYQFYLEIIRNQLHQTGNKGVEADVLYSLGLTLIEQDDYAKARSYLEQSLLLFKQTGNRRGAAQANQHIGLTFDYENFYDLAKERYIEARAIFRIIGDKVGESWACNNIGSVFQYTGDYKQAEQYFRASLEICTAMKLTWGKSIAWHNIGVTHLLEGEYDKSEIELQRALSMCKFANDDWGMVWRLTYLCFLYHKKNQDKVAKKYGERALKLAKTLQNKNEIALCSNHLAQVLFSLGETARSTELFEQAIEIRQSIGQKNLLIESLAGIARNYLALNQLEKLPDIVEKIFNHLIKRNLYGTDDPFLILTTLYQALNALNDPRTEQVLARIEDWKISSSINTQSS